MSNAAIAVSIMYDAGAMSDPVQVCSVTATIGEVPAKIAMPAFHENEIALYRIFAGNKSLKNLSTGAPIIALGIAYNI